MHPVSGSQLTTVRVETSLGTFEVLDETNEPEGNIRLIVAGPELLAALEMMMASFASHFPHGIEVTTAKAALAAAKGAA